MQLRHPLARWGLSLLVLSAATAINFGVQSATGRAVPFLPYFPALLLIAVLAGPAPAAVCALASAVVVEFFWLDPAYSLRISRVQDLYALAFFCMANGIIVVAAWHLTRVTAQLRQLEEKNRKSMEVAQAAEERFRIALRGVPVFAWMCGPDRRYTWAYSSVEAIQAEALIGKQLGSVQPPSTYPDFWDTIERVWSTGIGQTLPVEWKQGGVLRQFISSIEPVKDAGGAVVGLLGSAVDVTEMRRAQESLRASEARLEEAARQKDAFIATLAHELRNPLAPIRYAMRLLEPDTPPEMAAGAREIINRQLAHMAHLLDDLLDVGRITHGRLDLRVKTVNLVKVVEQALETARPLMSAVNHTMQVHLPAHPVLVRGDPTRLAQILGNLLNNAAKYTDAGGTVEVDLIDTPSQVQVRIRDSGVGIPAEVLPNIFQLFSQGIRGPRAQGGLGIGLALARQLAELHGGTLTAESEGPQHGATFTLSLPRVSEPDAILCTPDRKVPRALFAATSCVLVADDNMDAARSLAHVLELAGFSCHVVHDGLAAQQAAEQLRPTVALLDIGMPKADGQTVARWIRSQPWGSRVTLIAITGWGQESDRAAARDAGFDAHFTKPVDPDELIETLASATAQARGSPAHQNQQSSAPP